MFAKIAKMFVGLSTTIIETRRKLVLILHLEAKYAKIYCKNEIYAKNWVRSTWTAKVNSGKKSTINSQKVKVNAWKSQLPEVNVNLEMTSAMTRSDDVSDDATRTDVARWHRSDVSRRVHAREGAWDIGRRVAELTENIAGTWGRVERWMVTGPASLSRSFDDLHAYMICVLVRGQKQHIWRRQ